MKRFMSLLLCLSGLSFQAYSEDELQLKQQCPPSFEKLADGSCSLVSQYQFYDSLQNQGVGGTQTALPDFRNGFTPMQMDLGRYLFFDPILSVDGTMSCASCHKPEQGLADGKALSIGVAGTETKRGAPTLWNVGFLKSLFWDARATTLEEQMLGPLYAADEMGNNPAKLLKDLNAIEKYKALFKQAYPESSDDITLDEIYTALAAFQTSLISLNSRYDQYAHGYHKALTDEEIQGMNVFRSFVARCAECHTPPLFTNQQVAVIGAPEPEGRAFDVGAEKTYNAEKLKGGFKVPTLRNITKTAPYMHSGRFATLKEASEFYTKGRGHAVPEGMNLHLHWHIWEPKLTDRELDLIVTFLGSLTDESLTPQIPNEVPSGLTPVDHIITTKQQEQAEAMYE